MEMTGRPSATDASVLADVAKKFGISDTEVAHYARELDVSAESIRHPRWRGMLEAYIEKCLRGGLSLPKLADFQPEFIWRFGKKSLAHRGFARSAVLRRAVEKVALASSAHVERVGARLVVTLDACTVVLQAVSEGALIVTAFAHDPFPSVRFLDVAERVRDRVTLATRLGALSW